MRVNVNVFQAGRAAVAGCAIAMLGASCAPKQMPLTPEQQMNVSKADPQMQAVLDQLHKDGGTSLSTLSVEQARKGATAQMAAMEVAKNMNVKPLQDVGAITDTSFTNRDGISIPLKVYTPMGDGPFPVLVYFHGGGWVIGSVSSANPYDASCRELCSMAKCVVVSVDYRLAPEHRFPAAVNDCYDATQFVFQNPVKFRGDDKHVAVGGESAGGGLTVSVCLMARTQGGKMPCYMLSIYPVGGYFIDTPSAKANYHALPLDTPSLIWFYEKYLPSAAERTNPYFDIVDADLHGLPPSTLITDQIDPLMSDGVMLRDKLTAAGDTVSYRNYDGVTHEFFGLGAVVDKAKEAEMFAAQGLRSAFGM